MPHYDYIMAGGGAAGLSLAYYLGDSGLADKRILIIDKDRKEQNDRTWCFWTDGPMGLDEIIHRSWPRVRFTSRYCDLDIDLSPFRYCMIRGIDFYRHVSERFSESTTTEVRTELVTAIEDGEEAATVRTEGGTFTADYVFDSIFIPEEFSVDRSRYHFLFQHFRGWFIQTETDVFDPGAATMFDFRVLGGDGMRFMYILPFSPRNGLVEYTLFSPRLLEEAEYLEGIRKYLDEILGVKSYEILEYEKGVIPMTEQPFPRQDGKRIMRIGTKAGMVKGSTGFAFHRTQRDSRRIVASLETEGHPFAVPAAPRRYRVMDAMLLHLLTNRPELSERIFSDLFSKNPVERLFRFLDEQSSVGQDLAIMASVPWWPFIRAWLEIQIRRGM